MFDKNDKIGVCTLIFVLVLVFYFGTTVSSPQTKQLEFLMTLVSLFTSFATIFAVYLAYQTYNRWVLSITQPEQFDIDRVAFDNLKQIHSQCFFYADMACFGLEDILRRMGEYDENDPDECGLLEDWAECVAHRKATVSVSLMTKFNNDVLERSGLIFSDISETPQELRNYQAALRNYIFIAERVCRNKKPANHLVHSFPYIDSHSEYCISDLNSEGKLFKDLELAYKAVSDFYKSRWPTRI